MSSTAKPGYMQTEVGVEYGLVRAVQHLLGTDT